MPSDERRRLSRRSVLAAGAAVPLLEPRPAALCVLADAAYDSVPVPGRAGSRAVIKQNPTRKRIRPFDANLYKNRNLIERAFSHLKDWRRVATRYDKLARNFGATVALAILVIWWI